MMNKIKYHVTFLLFDGFEPIDALGAYNVFLSANKVSEMESQKPLFEIHFVSNNKNPVKDTGVLQYFPTSSLEEITKTEILIVPGGKGLLKILDDAHIISWIKKISRTTFLTTSVCRGSFLLGKSGLLDGKEATSLSRLENDFKEHFPQTKFINDENKKVVKSGNVWTARGIANSITLAFSILEEITDNNFTNKVKAIFYDAPSISKEGSKYNPNDLA